MREQKEICLHYWPASEPYIPLWNDNTLLRNGSPFSSRLTPCCRFQLEISDDDDQVVLWCWYMLDVGTCTAIVGGTCCATSGVDADDGATRMMLQIHILRLYGHKYEVLVPHI